MRSVDPEDHASGWSLREGLHGKRDDGSERGRAAALQGPKEIRVLNGVCVSEDAICSDDFERQNLICRHAVKGR